MIRKLIAVFAFLIGVMPVLGQATGTFSGTSANVAPTSTATISAQLQLVGCGANLPIYNGTVLTQTVYPITLTSNAFSVIVPANDAITCGGQAYSLYSFTWLANGFPIAPSQAYRVSTSGSCNVSGTCTPISFIPPVIGNAAGAYCPAATPIFTGFTANYQIQCAAAVSNLGAALPITGGSLQGNLTVPSPFITALYSTLVQYANGIPQADQFPGADMCVKVRAAEVFALANGIRQVDASHFSGTQACSVDMFGALAAITAPVYLTVRFGTVIIQTTVEQTITNSSLEIDGMGRTRTIFEYVGSSAPADGAVLYSHAQSSSVTNGLTDVTIRGVGFLGNAQVTNALNIKDTNRSQFHDILAWGATTDAILAQGDVTTTWDNVKESGVDAAIIGSFPAPTHAGIEFAKSFASNNQCTDSTVTDNAAEYVAGIGWLLTSASNMVFTAGTSEANQRGISVISGSKWNTFISPDIEGNSANVAGVDVNDQGQSNYYINGLYTSPCTACNSMTAGTGGGQWILGDAGPATQWTGSFNVLGNNPNFQASQGITSLWNVSAVSVGSQMFGSTGAAPTYFNGTGITSVTCADPSGSAPTCTAGRGTARVVNASATTTTSFMEVIFPGGTGLASIPSCQITQQQGPNYLGLYVSAVSRTAMFIANANTLSGTTTFYVSWTCQL